MATEYPPLNKIYVFGYSANDRDFPILSATADPRVAGYQVPKDLSACPDKRYPNHVFTGAQPISGDQRVRHVWEILPSPWVPFTRYDDDLGPVQGRRRSVKNDGQVASLTAETRTTYEAREGSAIVYTELEETWSIATDEDGNSLFPVRDRDFYDASRGPVQERRQLFVPTGEEAGSLENVNGVITQTSYEPYNEFLSVKIVQTYKVDGPQLIGKATDNEGQLVTITTQRKGAKDYVAPNPTATRTVEANREDAESLVERIVDTPEVFKANTFSIERPDPIPQKFRVLIPTLTEQENLAGNATMPSLSSGQFSKSEQQVTKFVKRISKTSRDTSSSGELSGQVFTTELGGGIADVKDTYPFNSTISTTPEFGTVSDEIENLGDGTKIRRQIKLKSVKLPIGEFDENGDPKTEDALPLLIGQEYDQELDIVIPYKELVAQPESELATGNRKRVTPRDPAHSAVVRYDVEDAQDALDEYYFEVPEMTDISLPNILKSVTFLRSSSSSSGNGSGFGDTYYYSWSRRNAVGGTISYEIESGFSGTIPSVRAIFFLPKGGASPEAVLAKINQNTDLLPAVQFWPNVRPKANLISISEISNFQEESKSVSFDSGSQSESSGGSFSKSSVTIPPCIHDDIQIVSSDLEPITQGSVEVSPSSLEATDYPTFPVGNFLYRINANPYRFSYVRVDALIVKILQEYV